MRKSIIYFVIIIATIMLMGCSKDEFKELPQYGFITFEGGFLDPGATGKIWIPPCSDKKPTEINYTFRDVNGFTRFEKSRIAIESNIIYLLDEIKLPVGTYTLEDISLLAEDGTLTHAVPSTEEKETNSFFFSQMVDNPLPYVVEVFPNEETAISGELLCYTPEHLDLGSIKGNHRIIDLQSIYILIPTGGCVNRFVIISDGKKIRDTYSVGRGIRGYPVYKYYETMTVQCYRDDELLDSVTYTEPFNTQEYVVFKDVCD